MAKSNYEMRVIGLPKTIDNDLAETDHTPGYGSAAKYIVSSIMEIRRDAIVYYSPIVIVVEIMGRDAGWLTAAAGLAGVNGEGPDLIYLPETDFDDASFLASVKESVEKTNVCIVAASEGIHYANGDYVGADDGAVDVFGHKQLGGLANTLKRKIADNLHYKCKAVELNICQRCAMHNASATDVREAVNCGKTAVKKAIGGETGKMVSMKRAAYNEYRIDYVMIPLENVANKVKHVPMDMINSSHNGITQKFIDYALPLINGRAKVRISNGMEDYAHLKKNKAQPE